MVVAAVPPEGGFGWVVLGAYVFNTVLVIQLMHVFGLIFKDVFKQLNISGTDAAAILNTNNAFSLMLGILIGPVLRRFGSRVIGVAGVLLVFVGMALTSMAKSFVALLAFYGFIMSAGVGLTYPAFTYTFNAYFKARRSLATGLAMTCTGTAAIFMPQLISLVMREFGPRGTCLIFSALALNSALGACLLHPIEWHQPAQPAQHADKRGRGAGSGLSGKQLQDEHSEHEVLEVVVSAGSNGTTRNDVHGKPLNGLDQAAGGNGCVQAKPEGEEDDVDAAPPAVEQREPLLRPPGGHGGGSVQLLPAGTSLPTSSLPPRSASCLSAAADFFDLELLRDPGFCNLILGLSFGFFSEINFGIFLPFVFAERGFDTQEIATLLSLRAVADTVFRFLAPFLHRLVGRSSRFMYTASLVGVVALRLALLFCHSRLEVTLAFAVMGAMKGFRVVFYAMVLPDAVPIERLPTAQGLQSLVNGIIFVSFGPFIGWMRDHFGTYEVMIPACSLVAAFPTVMWATEWAVRAVMGLPYKVVTCREPDRDRAARDSVNGDGNGNINGNGNGIHRPGKVA